MPLFTNKHDTDIREYVEELPVQIMWDTKRLVWVIVALNEAGCNGVHVDLIDVCGWVKENMHIITGRAPTYPGKADE